MLITLQYCSGFCHILTWISHGCTSVPHPEPPSQINLDRILKSRNITLLTKICLVKATVFPVVMYGCESWTIKKAECQRIDVFELWY